MPYKPISKVCELCDKEYMTRRPRQRFCSIGCNNAARKKRVPRTVNIVVVALMLNCIGLQAAGGASVRGIAFRDGGLNMMLEDRIILSSAE